MHIFSCSKLEYREGRVFLIILRVRIKHLDIGISSCTPILPKPRARTSNQVWLHQWLELSDNVKTVLLGVPGLVLLLHHNTLQPVDLLFNHKSHNVWEMVGHHVNYWEHVPLWSLFYTHCSGMQAGTLLYHKARACSLRGIAVSQLDTPFWHKRSAAKAGSPEMDLQSWSAFQFDCRSNREDFLHFFLISNYLQQTFSEPADFWLTDKSTKGAVIATEVL